MNKFAIKSDIAKYHCLHTERAVAFQTSGVFFDSPGTIYARSETLEEVINSLENDLSSVLQWFTENVMVANPEKFQLMFLGVKSDQQMCLRIDDQIINQCQQVKLLGVTIDSKLNFDRRILELCGKVNKKVSAFSRVRNYLDDTQAKLLCKTTVLANFNYCPLIWMFSSKAANNEINRTHKRALRVLHKEYDASFELCLQREADTTIHIKNLQKLRLEVFKTLNSLNPSYLWDLFNTKQIEYNLRIKNLVKLPQLKTHAFGRHSVTFRGSILWNTLSDDIKSCENVAAFKKKIKTWNGVNCSCKLCC